MKQRLSQALSLRKKRHIVDPGRISAAVLLPIYQKQGQYQVLFIKRTDNVRAHRDEISFPGGTCEDMDKTLLDTALRECAEEIGLAAGDIEILGELDDEASVKTNYVISPFVALIPWPYPLRADGKETEEIIGIPVSALLENGFSRQEVTDGETLTKYFYLYRGRVIWGATARILKKFLDIFTRAMDSKESG
ncbi:NUDIX hydrolase [Chloroflexota bacterium]